MNDQGGSGRFCSTWFIATELTIVTLALASIVLSMFIIFSVYLLDYLYSVLYLY